MHKNAQMTEKMLNGNMNIEMITAIFDACSTSGQETSYKSSNMNSLFLCVYIDASLATNDDNSCLF